MKYGRQFYQFFQLSQRVKNNTKNWGKKISKNNVLLFSKIIFSRFPFHTKFPHVTFESTGAHQAYWKISFCISSVLNGL